MKAVIDTSSLVSLVRYYLPFDKGGKLASFLEEQILAGSILVIDKVVEECGRLGGGQVVGALPFLKKARYRTDTSVLTAVPKFYNLVDNNFVNGSEKNRLDEAEYQLQRDDFLNSADLRMILYAYNSLDSEPVIIITEETGYSNDGKVFKKIPEICRSIGITTMSLPAFLSEYEVIDCSIDVIATTLF